ncbi:hypothetical protein BIV57_18700 [Mangrovactinospora gilvigrisea]|uniref:Roadblock/LAMTOR2 domain-containing protein n=1 Tax=Mangrovactinospora gilvigrisea TaxID=1428644 RepID=A0A1J7C363_9ACTN|nr:roadblock/LC7 domain-containing protein [Mangrovactinospora gilvigrisea]OIV36004.1 hypothetical protein BIV57_18700 [Mangrovactinospora gilvigrisea]
MRPVRFPGQPPEAPPPGSSRAARNLKWLLANLVSEVEGIRQVVVVSADGLLLASSGPGAPEPAPSGRRQPARVGAGVHEAGLATVVSGVVSLASGAAGLLDQGEMRQTVIAMDRGHLFVMSISDGSCLGVHAAEECDLGVVGYQMAVFVERAGHVLTPELRTELRASLATTGAG